MKIVRFECEGKIGIGEWDEGGIRELTGDLSSLELTGKRFHSEKVLLLAPCMPSKIIAVGKNYPSHVKELSSPTPQEPILFMKPTSALLPPNGDIIYPSMSRRVDFEAELGVVIKQRVQGIPEDIDSVILGYTCINDVTARDLQKKDGQWTRAKSFDTFAPVGPWIVTDINPGDLCVESYLNGERRQSGRTSEMLFDIPTLIRFISGVMTLEPGDLIATGTPAGIGPMKRGDTIEIRIDEIGTLKNQVV